MTDTPAEDLRRHQHAYQHGYLDGYFPASAGVEIDALEAGLRQVLQTEGDQLGEVGELALEVMIRRARHTEGYGAGESAYELGFDHGKYHSRHRRPSEEALRIDMVPQSGLAILDNVLSSR